MDFNIEKLNMTPITARVEEVMTDFDIKLEHANEFLLAHWI